ncbi:MAG: hypothetical protein ACLR8Y_10840 [Alistipes indistinctus]
MQLSYRFFRWEPYKAQDTDRIPSKGFAVDSAEGHFHPYEFTRHAIGDNDILIETMYAGICHSDLHAAWDEHPAHGIHGHLSDGAGT